MTVEARLRLRHPGCFTEALTDGRAVAQLSDDGEQSMFVASADAPPDLGGILDGLSHSLRAFALVSQVPRIALARGACPPHGPEAIIREAGCGIVWPALFFDGGETYTVVAPSRADLKRVVEGLGTLGTVQIESVAELRPEALNASMRLGEVFGGLTERQLDVLSVAVAAGYYESPRKTTTEEMAKRFGVSRVTFDEHLRKAEAKILTGLMATLARHPLARAALRGARAGEPGSV